MTLLDRVGRSVFVALAVGLGWGIRGDFGHLVGAMYPGAVLALALAYVSGQRSLFLWMPVLAAVSGMAIGSGGTMSYGMLHGYAQADTFVNYSYGFVTLFLQGSAWGTFGGALIGLLLEKKPLRGIEWLSLIGTLLAAGWFVSFLAVDVLKFDINPPRNNTSIAFMGAALGQIAWLAWNRRGLGLRGALLGYFGFGLGMAAGRLLGNIANDLQTPLHFTINHWNVMEVSCGLIGGFIFCFGMVNRPYPEPPAERNYSVACTLGIIYVLGVIPLWHRLGRIRPTEKLAEWTRQLLQYGYAEPEKLAETILWLVDGVCVLGFVGAGLWLLIHFGQRRRFAALPALWLSGTMLLFQNLTALYFFYPRQPGQLNMHTVFWVLFLLMVVYVALAKPRSVAESGEAADDRLQQPGAVAAWCGAGLAALAGVIALAGLVNGENTMKAANTRWPIWSWTQGPFPGREAK